MASKLKKEEKLLLKEMIFDLNSAIMDLLEMHPSKDGVILTDDEREMVQIQGKFLKIGRIDTKDRNKFLYFRPVLNSKLMFTLFGYYTEFILKPQGRYVKSIEYGPGNSKKDKIYLEVSEEGYDTIRSKPYMNDALRYIDCMFQLAEIRFPFNLEVLDELLYKG